MMGKRAPDHKQYRLNPDMGSKNCAASVIWPFPKEWDLLYQTSLMINRYVPNTCNILEVYFSSMFVFVVCRVLEMEINI